MSGIRDQRVHLHIYIRVEPRSSGTSCLSYYTTAFSGSVVECLSQVRGVTGSSLTDVTALCP